MLSLDHCSLKSLHLMSVFLTLSVLMSIKVNIRGRVLKSTFKGRVLLPRYMLIKVDTHSQRYAAKACTYIFSTGNKIKKIIQHRKS